MKAKPQTNRPVDETEMSPLEQKYVAPLSPRPQVRRAPLVSLTFVGVAIMVIGTALFLGKGGSAPASPASPSPVPTFDAAPTLAPTVAPTLAPTVAPTLAPRHPLRPLRP